MQEHVCDTRVRRNIKGVLRVWICRFLSVLWRRRLPRLDNSGRLSGSKVFVYRDLYILVSHFELTSSLDRQNGIVHFVSSPFIRERWDRWEKYLSSDQLIVCLILEVCFLLKGRGIRLFTWICGTPKERKKFTSTKSSLKKDLHRKQITLSATPGISKALLV